MNICRGCKFYLSRFSICGQGLNVWDQQDEGYCSRKEEGPPAEVVGVPLTKWEFYSNGRVDQCPKELRRPIDLAKLVHYLYEQDNSGVIITLVYRVNKIDFKSRTKGVRDYEAEYSVLIEVKRKLFDYYKVGEYPDSISVEVKRSKSKRFIECRVRLVRAKYELHKDKVERRREKQKHLPYYQIGKV